MTTDLSLGRIAGVPVGLNWSVLVVAALIVWSLAAVVFPDATPELSTGAHIAMGVVAAVIFLASILLHEIGHAVQARREGMAIDGITLWLFGGVARFSGMFPSAGAEFRIAIAGPAVTLVIGAACAGVALIGALPDAVLAVAGWLAVINIVILVFNLLPAFPLDGGRILRAALWQRGGDFTRATARAAGAGRVIAFGLIGLGILAFMLTGAFGGAWLALIGWFLLMAAGAESRAMLARQALRGLAVRDVMARDPVAAAPDATLGRFMDETVWGTRFTAYPVVRDGEPVGIIPFRRVAQVAREEWDRRTVGEHMVPLADICTARPDEPLSEVAAPLQESEVGRALVIDEHGRLVGVLSTTDIARALELRAVGRGDRRGAWPADRR